MKLRHLAAVAAFALIVIPIAAIPADAGPSCFGKSATIIGTNEDDEIIGTPQNDVIVAKKGNDSIHPLGGFDTVCANDGDDFVSEQEDIVKCLTARAAGVCPAGASTSGVSGGGNDRVSGGAGEDVIETGEGDDKIFGNGDADRLFGDSGNDRVEGGSGDDPNVEGEQGSDQVFCGSGDDGGEGGIPGLRVARASGVPQPLGGGCGDEDDGTVDKVRGQSGTDRCVVGEEDDITGCEFDFQIQATSEADQEEIVERARERTG